MNRQKLLSVVFFMWSNNMSFGTKSGCDFFYDFLKNNGVSELDLKDKSFYQIVKQYWLLDIVEINSYVYSLMELKQIDKEKYDKLVQELNLNEMSKS